MKSVKVLFICALLSPALASAGVFVCVDPATGKKTFTDKACETKAKGEKLDVKPQNFGDSGHRSGSSGQKSWNSQRTAQGVATTQYTGHRQQVEKARSAGGN